MTTHTPYVGVIGPADATATDIEDARAVGVGLADAGAILVCGGLGGVMEAACRGSTENGGLTVGLLPGTDRSAGNRFLTVAITTGLGELRNGLLVRAVDVIIAIGASWGTMSEVALARRTGVPVVALRPWSVGSAEGKPIDRGTVVDSAAEAVRQALALSSSS